MEQDLIHFTNQDVGRKDTGRGTFEISRHAILIANGPIKLSFQNISYNVNKKQILKNLTGYVLPGHTHYIMGASGAGKTTLLNVLAARVALTRSKRLEGDILLNDEIKVN